MKSMLNEQLIKNFLFKKKQLSLIAISSKISQKGIKPSGCSLPNTEEGRKGEQAGGGGGSGPGGVGVLDDVLRVGLVLLKDHEDGGVRHAVHAAVVQDVALALLRRGTDEAGVASDEFAH